MDLLLSGEKEGLYKMAPVTAKRIAVTGALFFCQIRGGNSKTVGVVFNEIPTVAAHILHVELCLPAEKLLCL